MAAVSICSASAVIRDAKKIKSVTASIVFPSICHEVMGPDAMILVFFEYVKAVYCHPDYLTYMQGISWEMLGWMKHKLESRLPGEISITSDVDDNTLMAESEEQLKNLLMKVKEESEKLAWNSTFRKLRSWRLVPSLHGK